MFQAQARWLLLAALCGSSLLACSDDAPEGPSNTAGSPSGGSAGSSAQGGSTSGSGGGSSTAGTMSSSGTGGAPTAGTGGTAAGAGGSGGGTGGSGGASAGSGGSGGSGGATGKTAVATITGATVEGKATFTQGATMTTLVLELTKCPDGVHSSHLHEEAACGNAPFTDAGGHWVPNGEGLGDYTCVDGKVTKEVMRGIDTWTVGDGGPNDVTEHTFVVHAAGDPNSGDRLGCGPVD